LTQYAVADHAASATSATSPARTAGAIFPTLRATVKAAVNADLKTTILVTAGGLTLYEYVGDNPSRSRTRTA
jgi:hypothetical protein